MLWKEALTSEYFEPPSLHTYYQGSSPTDWRSVQLLIRLTYLEEEPLPLYVGLYGLNIVKFSQMEGEALAAYHFGEERFRRHDPLNVVARHSSLVKYPWPQKNEVWQEEDKGREVRSFYIYVRTSNQTPNSPTFSSTDEAWVSGCLALNQAQSHPGLETVISPEYLALPPCLSQCVYSLATIQVFGIHSILRGNSECLVEALGVRISGKCGIKQKNLNTAIL